MCIRARRSRIPILFRASLPGLREGIPMCIRAVPPKRPPSRSPAFPDLLLNFRPHFVGLFSIRTPHLVIFCPTQRILSHVRPVRFPCFHSASSARIQVGPPEAFQKSRARSHVGVFNFPSDSARNYIGTFHVPRPNSARPQVGLLPPESPGHRKKGRAPNSVCPFFTFSFIPEFRLRRRSLPSPLCQQSARRG